MCCEGKCKKLHFILCHILPSFFFSLSRCCCCIALLLLKKRCIAKPTFYNISEFYESVNICKTLVKCAKLNICKIWIFNEAWNLKSTKDNGKWDSLLFSMEIFRAEIVYAFEKRVYKANACRIVCFRKWNTEKVITLAYYRER